MKFNYLTTLILGVFIMTTFTNSTAVDKNSSILEIAVRKVKFGKNEEFVKARTAFIAELKKTGWR